MTKIKLNLHDLLVDALGGATTQIPATVEVSELLDFNDAYQCDYDLDDVLADNRLIAHVWSTEDVRSIRPDLNVDQAWTVLQQVEKDLDSSRGIRWDDLEQTALDLFGAGNARRVERCQQALQDYGHDSSESNLVDLLADAMHWCQAKEHVFESLLERARGHFTAEPSHD